MHSGEESVPPGRAALFCVVVGEERTFISDAVDVVAQRATQRLKSCYRWVEEIEHITAGQMIHKVSNLFSVRARQTAITAKDDVKIDGERVHLG